MSGKPLSSRPLGLLIAVLGGTLGAPIGWIASPVVLLILNRAMRGDSGKNPNRFLAWSLIGVIGVPVSLTIFNGFQYFRDYVSSGKMQIRFGDESHKSRFSNQNWEAPSSSQITTGVNMRNYLRIKEGMSYGEVVAILGRSGQEMGSGGSGDYATIMYTWEGDGALGANMNAMFQNDRLIQKAQFGLE